MAFKDNASFLRFVTMGAVGARAAQRALNDQGHHIIELERNCCSNKIWRTKIKRMRLPDLLCTRCGQRYEVRAKSDLEIKMSHSPQNPERRWDAGMLDEDVVLFVHLPHGTTLEFPFINAFRVGELRRTEDHAVRSDRKSSSEGSELSLKWPAWAPKKPGEVLEIIPGPPCKVKVLFEGGRRYTYNAGTQRALIRPGDVFRAGDRFLTSAASSAELSPCPGDTWSPDVSALDPSVKYTAIKAARFREERIHRTVIHDALHHEDLRIVLEAAGALAAYGDRDGMKLLENHAIAAEADSAAWAMETVFILSELETPDARRSLQSIAMRTSLPEVRAAAFWGLRQTRDLLDVAASGFMDDDYDVREHTIMAIASDPLTEDAINRLITMMEGERASAAGASEAIRWAPKIPIDPVLTAASSDSNSSGWAFAALAGREPESVKASTSWRSIPPDLRARLESVWFRKSQSWAADPEVQDRLRSLREQNL